MRVFRQAAPVNPASGVTLVETDALEAGLWEFVLTIKAITNPGIVLFRVYAEGGSVQLYEYTLDVPILAPTLNFQVKIPMLKGELVKIKNQAAAWTSTPQVTLSGRLCSGMG
jgi:hypothetical protein